jgi:nucleoside-diphosphate kinase
MILLFLHREVKLNNNDRTYSRLIKPDAVQRGLIGEIIHRFEKVGLKIVSLKMKTVDNKFAKKHYGEEISQKWGEEVREQLANFFTEAPIVAMVLEGVEAIELVRKMIGSTEPKYALPGTIRGDYSHTSYKYCRSKSIVVRNIIHAFSDQKDAKREINLWFKKVELNNYESVLDELIY